MAPALLIAGVLLWRVGDIGVARPMACLLILEALALLGLFIPERGWGPGCSNTCGRCGSGHPQARRGGARHSLRPAGWAVHAKV